jgi:hypothetical protein
MRTHAKVGAREKNDGEKERAEREGDRAKAERESARSHTKAHEHTSTWDCDGCQNVWVGVGGWVASG